MVLFQGWSFRGMISIYGTYFSRFDIFPLWFGHPISGFYPLISRFQLSLSRFKPISRGFKLISCGSHSRSRGFSTLRFYTFIHWSHLFPNFLFFFHALFSAVQPIFPHTTIIISYKKTEKELLFLGSK